MWIIFGNADGTWTGLNDQSWLTLRSLRAEIKPTAKTPPGTSSNFKFSLTWDGLREHFGNTKNRTVVAKIARWLLSPLCEKIKNVAQAKLSFKKRSAGETDKSTHAALDETTSL